MNRTRVIFARAARRLVPGLLMLAGFAVAASQTTSAADSTGSPYLGEPVLTAGHSGTNVVSTGGAPTLRVGGVGHGGNSADLDPYFQVPGGGFGVMGRIGHVAGKTVGRKDSLTHINLQPYMFVDQNMFFSDLRMYRMNDGGVGGNVGGGWRRYFEGHDTILGAIGYYDVDDTRSQEFQQLGLSLEMLSRWLDVRANWYVPFGETEQILGTSFLNGTQRFEGNALLFDTVTTFGDAAEGVDVTLTSPVPWEILEPFNVEASAGFYHFQVPGKNLDKLWGYRMRVDASFFDRMMHTFVELTSDRQHNTNVIFGASLDYYGGFESRSRLKDRQYYRMSEWVRRNYNVVTVDSSVVNVGVPVINPATDLPYFFVHVANNPTVGGPEDGTVENPFEFINNAIATVPGGDVYYVHGGSSFNGVDAEITVPNDKILLGEGVPQELPADGFGLVSLPVVRPGIVTLSNSVGSAITAGDNVLVGGFTIINPAVNGVNVSGVSSGVFRDLTIQGAGGDGVLMLNTTGTFLFDDVTVQADDGINGAGGIAFHVDGGNAATLVTHTMSDPITNPTFENSGGNVNEVVLIENTTGGFVNLASASGATAVNDVGGGGVRVLNNFGNVTLSAAQITDTDAAFPAGMEIRNNAANVTINGDVTIENAANIGFLVADVPTSGTVNVSGGSDVFVNDRNSIGADFRNINGQVRFTQGIGLTAPSSLVIGPLMGAGATDPAVRFSASSGTLALNDLTIADSLAEGILIGDVTGVDVNTFTARFTASGTTTINNVGVLDDLATPSIRIQGTAGSPEASTIDFQDILAINTRLARGIHIENTSLDVDGMRSQISFSGITTVNNNNTNPSTRSALFIQNGAGTFSFGSFTANDNILNEPAVDIRDVSGGVGFNNLVIENAQGTGAVLPGPLDVPAGLLVNNVASFSTVDGTIEVFDESAIDIHDTGYQVVLTSVDSINTLTTNEPEFGIHLLRNDGMFTILGDGATLGSGGTISNIGTTTIVGGETLVNGAGLIAEDADVVVINLQDYLGNVRGLDFRDMNEDDTQGFTLDSLQVSNSETEAVFTENVRNILIEDSIFQDNGSLVRFDTPSPPFQSDTILITVSELIDDPLDPNDQDNPEDFPYLYTIRRNQFVDTTLGFLGFARGADAVSIQTEPGLARGARLDLFFEDNTFMLNRFPLFSNVIQQEFTSQLEIIWDGIINADILRNVGNLTVSGGQRGFDINQTHSDDPVASFINFNDNVITGPAIIAGDFVGANFAFANTVQMTVDNNDFTLGTVSLTSDALRFRLTDLGNFVDITNNNLFPTGFGTGVHVQIVNDQSSFFIEGNRIGDVANPARRGFRFDTIQGTANLFGVAPNLVEVVNPANVDNFFSIGSGTVNGQININGVFGP